MKRRVCVVITARPSYSRIRSALEAIQAHPELELQLVLAASALLDRYGDLRAYIAQDGFEVQATVFTVLEGGSLTTMAKTTGLGIMELATVFDQLQPDLVVTIADRYETLSTAVAAAYTNRPLVHIQGGEVTGSIDEKVRHAVTKLADLHLVSTDKAAERVARMGEDVARIHVTGCPSIDLAAYVQQHPTLDFDPITKYGGVGAHFGVDQDYLVVMQHPVTQEHDRAYEQITMTLRAVQALGLPVFWFWPNVDAGSDGTSKGIRAFREHVAPLNIHFFKNMEPVDFLRLILHSRCLVGNSSVGIRESSYLGVPVVNIGSRQEGRERHVNVRDVPYDPRVIHDAIQQQIAHGVYPSSQLYGDGQAGSRIAKLLVTASLDVSKRLMY